MPAWGHQDRKSAYEAAFQTARDGKANRIVTGLRAYIEGLEHEKTPPAHCWQTVPGEQHVSAQQALFAAHLKKLPPEDAQQLSGLAPAITTCEPQLAGEVATNPL